MPSERPTNNKLPDLEKLFSIFFHSKEKNENSNVLLFCNSLQLQLIDRIVEQLEKVGLTEYEAKII